MNSQCPCLSGEPCSQACSCAFPHHSGGCKRCAQYEGNSSTGSDIIRQVQEQFARDMKTFASRFAAELYNEGGDGECPMCAVEEKTRDLREALQLLYEETADYIRINHLGDVHQNVSMQKARDALARAKGR